MKQRKGFTLMELIVTMAIIAIVMVAITNLLRVPTRANQMSAKEYQVQSALRVASETVNTSVRDASAVFLLTKEPPSDLKQDLSDKWDYLICEEKDGISEVVHYRWMKTGSGWQHVRKVVAEAKSEKVHFFIDFQTSDNGKLLKYQIMARDIETGQEKEVSSEIKPLNSFNIVDNTKVNPVTGKKTGNALAFRSDVPDPEMGGQQGYDKITVSLVLDISGSMWGNLDSWYTKNDSYRKPGDGYVKFFADDSSIFNKKNQLRDNWKEGYDKNYYCRKENGKIYRNLNSRPYRKEDIKNEILKKQAKALVDKLVTSPNKERIEVALYPFSEESFPDDSPGAVPERYKFKALQNGGTMQDHLVKSAIDSFVPRSGTNVGDGIRRAYHEMLSLEQANQTKSIKNFILVLTDGAPNISSELGHDFYFGSGRPGGMGKGYSWSKGAEYMKDTAAYVKSFPNDLSGTRLPHISANAESVDATVIGFSNRERDNEQCTNLGKAIGAEPGSDGKYFITAGSEAALDAAFSQFTDKVLDKASLWYVVSPK